MPNTGEFTHLVTAILGAISSLPASDKLSAADLCKQFGPRLDICRA